jgi:hypothetical protein
MDRNWLQEIVDKANENRDRMDGTTATVQRIIADVELVFGVWQDASKPLGVGLHVIKGHRRLATLPAGTEPASLKWDAIPCTDAEQAMATQRVLGEKTEQ